MKAKFPFLILLVLALASCKDGHIRGPVIEIMAEITVVDAQNVNLIDNGRFNPDSLRIYYLVNNKKVLFHQGNLDHPRGFYISNGQKDKRLMVTLNDNQVSPITILEYGMQDADTLTCEFLRNGGSVQVRKITLNGELKWRSADPSFPEVPSFKLIK